MSAPAPRFGEVAATLAENGYEPLPVHWCRKNPCAGEAWQHYKFSESDLTKHAQAGTGLLCGRVIGVDIDVRDAALAAEIEKLAEEMLGAAPRRIGQAPKVLRLYQAANPFAKQSTRGYRLPSDAPEDKLHRVEILAQGQQFVAFNIHPDTGKPYEWNGAGSPLTVPIGLLPEVSETLARDFIEKAEAILARRGTPGGRLCESDDSRRHEPNEELQAQDRALLEDALGAIPNNDLAFDDWLRVLYAVKGALGENGLKCFLEWSAKSSKDVPTFSTREFLAAKPQRIGAGTVYFLAGEHGWKRPGPAQAPESWPEPVNIFAELTAPPFTPAELPPQLGAYPQLFAELTGIDPSILLSAAVAAAAAAITDRIQICGASSSSWFTQARLWTFVVAPPGSGKTPGQRAMLDPLWRLHRELDEQWRKEVAALEMSEDEPKRPPRPRVIVGDTTLEALSEVLADNERGVLIAAEEFDSWIGAMDQYRSGGIGRDRGEWLRLFDGGPHSIERIKRGTVFLPNWAASILTATTPAAMRRLARNLPEDGLIQRFIVVVARRQRIVATPERAEVEAQRTQYAELLRRLYALTPRARNGVVSLSPAAAERFNAWRAENLALQEAFGSLDSALEAHIAKYADLALRLTLTFHCAEIASQADPLARDPGAWMVSLDTLETALRYLRRASQHALALYLTRRGGAPAFELARNVARFLLARTAQDSVNGLQRRDVLRHVLAFRNAEEGEQGAALRLLEDLGWIRPTEGGYQKPQPTRFAINPDLGRRFADMAARERQRRAAVRERIAESVEERRDDHGQS